MTIINQEIADRLIEKEMAIVAAQQRGDIGAVGNVLADEFCEIGSSGRMFSKLEILESIRQVKILHCSFEQVRVLPIDDEHAIVTYVSNTKRRYQGEEATARTYRSSTWKKAAGEWRLIFHQGTPLATKQ
jgi:glyoxylase I family protein